MVFIGTFSLVSSRLVEQGSIIRYQQIFTFPSALSEVYREEQVTKFELYINDPCTFRGQFLKVEVEVHRYYKSQVLYAMKCQYWALETSYSRRHPITDFVPWRQFGAGGNALKLAYRSRDLVLIFVRRLHRTICTFGR